MPIAAAALLLAGLASPFHLERVDLVSEDPGTWINYDVPTVRGYFPLVGVRFAEQVKLVWLTRSEHISIGTSLRSQSIVYERAVRARSAFRWSCGVQTRLALPNGVFGGIAWRRGRVRIGAGVSALSGATWARPSWTSWRVLPVVGLGLGRRWRPDAGD